MSNQAILAHVSGRVQGVGFRFHTQYQAEKLGLRGYAKNLHDGRVEVHAEGGEAALERLAVWLQAGPPGSKVTDLTVERRSVIDCQGFEIL